MRSTLGNQLQDWGQELYRDECEGQELYEEYLKAVDDIQHQLSGIKPIKVNALEMLFDAEQAEMESTEADTITKEAISNEDYDVPEEDEHIAALLEDPIAPLKQLKKQSKMVKHHFSITHCRKSRRENEIY